ncbi:MAG: L-serine ammonia-lyase [Herbiconiux sp.]|nr:L-serine ammonia-lyase [Herbiconiux sp.]
MDVTPVLPAARERIAGVFELFSIGIGPSSSHTVGPMRAARAFALECAGLFGGRAPDALQVDVYGSLAATGRGHNTFGAVLLGLEGCEPESVDPEAGRMRVAELDAGSPLRLAGTAHPGPVLGSADIVKHPLTVRGAYANEVTFAARFGDQEHSAVFYSIGGGFILRGDVPATAAGGDARADSAASTGGDVPYDFASGEELLTLCRRAGLPVHALVLANEAVRHPGGEAGVVQGLHRVWSVMRACIEAGLSTEGVLPGGLKVPRRAARLARALAEEGADNTPEWATIAAMAVNEENAAGNRVVTAPTNGAAGIVPAVLSHALRHRHPGDFDGAGARRDIETYLLTAAAIGGIIKQRASISGADVGCQGEVGSASAMAAAGLAALLGADAGQVENAAEVAMEHHLGLTCDPIGGLVQIPCIERNGVAAVTAITAAKLALGGDGAHRVSFDQVVETMRQTGADMSEKYRETSRGGLAVNVPEC